jgi:hypothetical protein
MHVLIQHVQNILEIDWQTLTVIGVLCGIAAYFLREYLANPPMIVFVYPVLVLFAVLAQYFFILTESYSPNKLDEWLMWTIMSAIFGTTLGTFLVAGFAVMRDRWSNARTLPR